MCDGPISSIIHTVNIDTMLNNNGVNNGRGLKKVIYICKQGLTLLYVLHIIFVVFT